MSERKLDISESLLKLAAIPVVAGACFFSAYFWKIGASPIGILTTTDVVSYGVTSLPQIGANIAALAILWFVLENIPLERVDARKRRIILRIVLLITGILIAIGVWMISESIPDNPTERIWGASREAYLLSYAHIISFCIAYFVFDLLKKNDTRTVVSVYIFVSVIYGVKGLADGELQSSKREEANATICFETCSREELALVTATHLLVRREGIFVYLANDGLKSYSFDRVGRRGRVTATGSNPAGVATDHFEQRPSGGFAK